ncbi:MAG: DUF523 and DUF1722 domain-containing protein [candidate division WOR-3 bacterium]|nr:DUF523 and DUF1722 domain-containing protein [candidate division WOR-3 bacterium]
MEKPRIILSRCFSYPVRYNGGIVHDEFVEILKKYINYELVCPEVEIGLGVPRPKIIILKDDFKKRLYQPETGRDLTHEIKKYISDFVKKVSGIDGFVLKSKSPSCGITSANYYKDDKIAGRTDGFFAEGVKNHFPELPAEHEGRLKNLELREHFLIRIFSYAEFRRLEENLDAGELVKFHTRYKYLLMTYSQKNLKEMGKIVADGKTRIEERISIYKKLFYNSFIRRPSRSKHFNTFLHIYGYFSKGLNQDEKKHFLSLLDKYKNGTAELSTILEMIKNFSYRFSDTYLLSQKYINPFPEELIYTS